MKVDPTGWLGLRVAYEADVVSGATVAVKAGGAYQRNNPAADVVTTASVRDLRSLATGAVSLRHEDVTFTTSYAYSTERDYRSHSINPAIRTDVYGHNTQLEISWAKSIDEVCDRVQGTSDAVTRRRALEDATGCFTKDPLRTGRDLGVDGFQGSWSQSWTPILATQIVYTAQLIHGFQSNPYRSVIVAQGLRAQEHHPEDRARHALAVRANLYLKPIKGALRLMLRAYRDTWDLRSGTAELEFERYFGEALRASLRGRIYRQSGALFFSDDYTGGDPPAGPKGAYFSGDRELSPFTSALGGVRATYTFRPREGRLLGLARDARASGTLDVIGFSYDEFTLGGAPIENARALVAGLSLAASF